MGAGAGAGAGVESKPADEAKLTSSKLILRDRVHRPPDLPAADFPPTGTPIDMNETEGRGKVLKIDFCLAPLALAD